MPNIPFEFWIAAAALTGSTLGFLAAAILSGAKRARIEKRTWAAAERYYRLANAEQREHRI